MRIIVLFNLKPGVDPAAYEAWARTVDIPGVRAFRSIADFQVYRVSGMLGSDAAPPYTHVEVIDVADMELFWGEVASESSQSVAKAFRGFLAGEPQFLTTEAL